MPSIGHKATEQKGVIALQYRQHDFFPSFSCFIAPSLNYGFHFISLSMPSPLQVLICFPDLIGQAKQIFLYRTPPRSLLTFWNRRFLLEVREPVVDKQLLSLMSTNFACHQANVIHLAKTSLYIWPLQALL